LGKRRAAVSLVVFITYQLLGYSSAHISFLKNGLHGKGIRAAWINLKTEMEKSSAPIYRCTQEVKTHHERTVMLI